MSDIEYGIVTFNLSDGDAVHHFVDRERWLQILAVHDAADFGLRGRDRLRDDIGWLTNDDASEEEQEEWAAAYPDRCPERKGRLLTSAYTQTWSVEPVDGVTGTLIGILTLP